MSIDKIKYVNKLFNPRYNGKKDSGGCFYHPDFPTFELDVEIYAFFSDIGLKLDYEVYEGEYDDLPSWNPKKEGYTHVGTWFNQQGDTIAAFVHRNIDFSVYRFCQQQEQLCDFSTEDLIFLWDEWYNYIEDEDASPIPVHYEDIHVELNKRNQGKYCAV